MSQTHYKEVVAPGSRYTVVGMHELSIMQSVVSSALEALNGHAVKRVIELRMQVGALSGVVEDSLQFCYELASKGTLLEGSRLMVTQLPVVIHCAACHADAELPGVQSFRCPRCGALCGDIRQGRELAIESLEIEEQP